MFAFILQLNNVFSHIEFDVFFREGKRKSLAISEENNNDDNEKKMAFCFTYQNETCGELA